MPISIKRGYRLMPEGRQKCKITDVGQDKGCELSLPNGKTITEDIIILEFYNRHGKATARCFSVMEENTKLGQIIMAVNGGEIPDEIDCLEDFLIGKELIIEVTHNVSAKTGRVFANAVAVLPEEMDEDDDEGQCQNNMASDDEADSWMWEVDQHPDVPWIEGDPEDVFGWEDLKVDQFKGLDLDDGETGNDYFE